MIELNRSKFGNWPSGPSSRLAHPTMFGPGFMGGGGAAVAYQITNSLRFRAANSASLSRTYTNASTDRKRATFVWSQKRGRITDTDSFWTSTLFSQDSVGAGYPAFRVGFEPSGDGLVFRQYQSSISTFDFNMVTSAQWRDVTAHQQFMLVYDSTQATPSDRIKIYASGVQLTSFTSATYPALNANIEFANNSTVASFIGSAGGGSRFFDGLLSEIYFIDGQALTPSSFGEINPATNQWVPRRYTGTYGTNGFFLEFKNASAATAAAIGKDTSGIGNNWTPSGISVTAGPTFDQMTDTPTNNFATLNPLFNPGAGAPTYSEGNLFVNFPGAGVGGAVGSIAMETGDFYWEVECLVASSANNFTPGVALTTAMPGSGSGWTDSTGFWGYISSTGNKINGGVGSTYGATFATGDIIGVRFNRAAGELSFSKNGVAQGVAYTGLTSGAYVPAFNDGTSVASKSYRVNFGQRPFTYLPLGGALALNTRNLPPPTIRRGDDGFDVVTRAGSNSPVNVTGRRFAPGIVWTKSRNTADSHNIADVVRGPSRNLFSNNTNAEDTFGIITSFNPDGYTLGGGFGRTNASGQNFVDWMWRIGAAYGCDAVNATGTGANRTLAHALNAVPHFMIGKRRDSAADWAVYHRSLAADNFLYLNLANAAASNATFWNGAPTSSVFNVGTQAATNANGGTYVYYLWTSIPGFSLFGSYVGNGSADGPFVWCGFEPALVIIKNVDGVQPWVIKDRLRASAFNPVSGNLYPNQTNTEDTISTVDMDFTAGGFKIRGTYAGINSASQNFIFMAFAEAPFKFATAR
jgi:hypothetical protein